MLSIWTSLKNLWNGKELSWKEEKQQNIILTFKILCIIHKNQIKYSFILSLSQSTFFFAII